MNRISDDSFTVTSDHIESFTSAPLECTCDGWAPVGEILINAPLIQVRAVFRWRELAAEDISGFDYRFLDQGNMGWMPSGQGGRDQFYSTSREPLQTPVRLNGNGKPLDPNVKIGKTMRTPAVVPTRPKGMIVDSRYEPDAVFIGYQRKKRARFSGLIPLFR